MNTDPNYTSPGNPQEVSIPVTTGTVSAAAVQQLAATKPWVRFMAVMMFISAG